MAGKSTKRLAYHVTCYLACAGCLAAQTSAAPEPATLSGSVANSVTGAPIARAHVVLRSNSEMDRVFGAITSPDGKFIMSKLPPGHYFISAEHIGFVVPASPDRSLVDLSLAAGDRKENTRVVLVPTGAISGRVFDAAGQPMEGVTVSAVGAGSESDSTDDKGQFRIGGLHPGKYRIRASPPSMHMPPETRTDGTVELHYAPTYYPDTLNEKQGSRIDLPPAAELTGIDIHLVHTPIVSISGRVLGLAPGAKNAVVELQRATPREQSSESGTVIKADGSFVIWRPNPGKYTLVARIYGNYGGRTRLQSSPVEIEVGSANLDRLELRMMPPFDVPLQFRFEGQQARESKQTRRITLQPVGAPMSSQPVDLAPDDSATLEKVQPGIYHVNPLWGSIYVKSIRVGSAETEGDVLDVRNGLTGPVTVTFSSNICQVKGVVTDSSGPVAHARVALVQPPERGRTEVVTTSADGSYTFSTVPPGKFQILAFQDESLAPEIDHGEGLDDFQNGVQTLELHAGDKITLDLQLAK